MRQKRYPRKVRVAELLRGALCEVLARSDGVPLLTLHGVDISGDYSVAKIYYSLLDEEQANLEQVEAYFEENAHLIRHKIAANLQLRSTPKLEFRYASGLREAEGVARVLRGIGEESAE